jgi:class 3 adenylate cyclase/tetratricopeptide (TPR) repeat protein
MQCGTPLGDVQATTHGERRQLTVVFCDLVGSTELSNRLDAERLREVITGYQKVCVECIERMNGHVAQFLGDGILAYFGYPSAAEDDVERALRTALDIRGALERSWSIRLGPRPGVRIGVHSGPVVVGEIGSGARRERLAFGATSNVAARLQAFAGPDTIVVSDGTLAHVPGLFVTSDLGRHALKGIDEPIRIHRVERIAGVRHRLDVTTLTPLVGRTSEIERLYDRWTSTTRSRGGIILVTGDAGIGKSRLVRAFRDRVSSTPHTWLDGYCAPRTASSAFQPVIELIGRGFGFADEDSPTQRLDRLERGLDLPRLDLPRIVPRLARLLSLPPSRRFPLEETSAEQEREQTLTALADLFLALAVLQPVLLTLEDLHWCDPSTLELLERLVPCLVDVPVMIVTTARPTFRPPWIPPSSTITLAPLSAVEIRVLALATTPGDALPPEVVEQIVTRADGIPLFAEELSRTLDWRRRDRRDEAEADDEHLAVPATLQDSLMARLDRLGEGKRVAQLCATLGRDFAYELVEAVSDDEPDALRRTLDRLVDAEILHQHGTPPRATYTFKHALLQDIAYQSQLDAEREKIHARIARLLESRLAGTTPEAVAEHYRAGGLVREAVRYYRRAGEEAFARWANAEAVEWFRRASDLEGQTDASPHRRLQTRMRLAEALARTGRRLEAAATYLEGVGVDPASDFELRRGAGYNFLRAGRAEDGLREVEALCREAGLGWPTGRLASLLAVIALRVRVARHGYGVELSSTRPVEPSAARRMDLCLDLALGLRLVAPLHSTIFASRYTLLALASGEPSRVARALALEAGTNAVAGSRRSVTADALVARADEIARDVGDPTLVAFVRILAANVAFQAGAWSQTRALCEEAEAILHEHGSAAAEFDIISMQLHHALYHLGDLPALARRIDEDQREARRGDSTAAHLDIGINGIVRMLLGNDPEAARRRAAAARAHLATRRFGLDDYQATIAEVESLLYERRGRDAARLLRARWRDIRGTFVLLSQLGAVIAWCMAGRCELAAAVEGDPRGRAGTRKAIRRLRRTASGWGAAFATLLAAGLQSVTERPDAARATLADAARQLDGAELPAYADAVRHRLFRLGPDTHAEAKAIEHTWAARGVVEPRRMFDMLAPGAWERSDGGSTR